MFKEIVNFIDENPIISGSIFIILGLVLFAYQINKKNSFKFKDHGLFSWKVLVQTWAMVLMLIISGLILIVKNI